MKIGIDIKGTKQVITGLQARSRTMSNPVPFYVNFHAYMVSRILSMFRRLKRGGSYRGETWRWFAPQYRRKDGTIIPAEGGVPYASGKGRVKGRLRGGGRSDADRVTASSSLMRHHGTMANSVLSRVKMRRSVMVMDTPVKYAAYQHGIRPFQFFETPADTKMASRLYLKYLNK
jgi:hypothetical protein